MLKKSYNFHQDFFEDPIVNDLGYSPRIEIKPAHLANGFFRAVCGKYVNNPVQHLAINIRDCPDLSLDSNSISDKFKSIISKSSPEQKAAFTFLSKDPNRRRMLNTLLTADKTFYRTPNFSSYTLSHSSHITSDNHDRGTGSWLVKIISNGENHPALDLLSELLNQDPVHRSDELSLLTLPLDISVSTENLKHVSDKKNNSIGPFIDSSFTIPIFRSIQNAFNRLALNDRPYVDKGGKLDTLRHFVTLGCFSVYLHLLNVNRQDKFVPMVFRFDTNAQMLKQASRSSYQKMLKTVENYLYQKISQQLNLISDSSNGSAFDNDNDATAFINSLEWQQPRARQIPPDKLEKYRSDCLSRYQYYRTENSKYSPLEALSYAIHEMTSQVLSSRPQDIARSLGTRIGLLSQYGPNQSKTYEPHPDFLEVLVRASVSRGLYVSLRELASRWEENFGILTGVLGNENERLAQAGLPIIDQGEWLSNASALAELLELSGYARRYADGVVLVCLD